MLAEEGSQRLLLRGLSLAGQMKIMDRALATNGEELRAAAKNPKNRWHRNIRTYLEALSLDALDELRVHRLQAERPKAIDAVVAAVVNAEQEGAGDGQVGGPEHGGEHEDEEQDEAGRVLYPRSYRCLYESMLKGMRLW